MKLLGTVLISALAASRAYGETGHREPTLTIAGMAGILWRPSDGLYRFDLESSTCGWKYGSGSAEISSSIRDDRVYVRERNRARDQLNVLDLKSGAQRWTQKLYDGLSVLSLAHLMILGADKRSIQIFDPDNGSIRRHIQFDAKIIEIFADDQPDLGIFLWMANGAIIAITETGAEIWRSRPTAMPTDVSLFRKSISVTMEGGATLGLARLTGQTLWNATYITSSAHKIVTTEDGLITFENGTLARRVGANRVPLWEIKPDGNIQNFWLESGFVNLHVCAPRKNCDEDQLSRHIINSSSGVALSTKTNAWAGLIPLSEDRVLVTGDGRDTARGHLLAFSSTTGAQLWGLRVQASVVGYSSMADLIVAADGSELVTISPKGGLRKRVIDLSRCRSATK